MTGTLPPRTCKCPNCDADSAHGPNKCRRRAKWFMRFHAVDRCHEVDDRVTTLCQFCWDAHVSMAKRMVADGMAGRRKPLCGGCDKPLTRLSAILTDVGRG